MKKIGIDARLVGQTGVGTYVRNLLYYLHSFNTPDVTFHLYVLSGKKQRLSFIRHDNFIIHEVPFLWHTFSEQTDFLKVLRNDALDLMHFSYFSYPVFYRRPFIATVHDVTPILFKTGRASTKNPLLYEIKHLFFRFVLSQQIHNAKYLITPTETVAHQITSLYGQHLAKKIYPLYEGVDYELALADESQSLAKQIGDGFFLVVGNFYPHKNVDMLIRAYSMSKKKRKLVLLGPDNYFSQRAEKMISSLSLQDNVSVIKNSGTRDLIYCYRHAAALVNPSLSEGFGLPLVEAMYYQLPILASKIKVFGEILGLDNLSFDPEDPTDIARCLDQFNEEQKKIKYTTLLSRYSFATMAHETLSLYKKALKM